MVGRWRGEGGSVLAHLHHPVCHEVDLRGWGQVSDTPLLVGSEPDVEVDFSEFCESFVRPKKSARSNAAAPAALRSDQCPTRAAPIITTCSMV